MPAGIKKILVVDDMLLNREILKNIFFEDYIIHEACDGVDALEFLDKNPDISVVLLDLVMPRLDGYGVISAMKKSEKLNNIPVIIITAYGNAEAEVRALNLGAYDMITKPFDVNVVRQRVKSAMANKDIERFRLENAVLRSEGYTSNHDSLTGIYNRAAFCRETRKMLDENPNTAFTLVRLNINKFKTINSLFGVVTGDALLCRVADLLAEQVECHGTYCRLDSDHFAACVQTSTFAGVDIGRWLEKASKVLSTECSVSISAGLYDITDRETSVAVMCDYANIALQTLKNSYNAHHAYYDSKLHLKTLNEQSICADMEAAVQNNEFVIYLQPIYSLSCPDIPIRAEALVRWNHPHKGIISPSEFIPVFEKNGFISVLDHHVWDLTCKYQRERLDKNLPIVPININASRRSLYSPTIAEDISSLVEKYGIDPQYIKIEITESAYTDNPEQLLKTVEGLQQAGFVICMDDFGSGYSSLNTLKDIPVDVLKIDMMFLRDFEKSERVGNILTSIVRMAKWLNIPTIAEGVETKTQVDFLRSIGCDCVQGFYFSKPLPTSEFEMLLNAPSGPSQIQAETLIDKSELDILFSGNKIINRLMNGLPGGLGFYEFFNERLEAVRVNDGYYELLGYDAQTFMEDAKNPLKKIYPDDIETLLKKCRKVLKTHAAERMHLRRYDSAGKLLYLDCSLRYLGGLSLSRPLICISFFDITELVETKDRLKRFRDYIGEFADAIPCGLFFYTYEAQPRLSYCNMAASELLEIDDDDKFMLYGSLQSELLCQNGDISLAECLSRLAVSDTHIVFPARLKLPSGGEKEVALRIDVVENEKMKAYRHIVLSTK